MGDFKELLTQGGDVYIQVTAFGLELKIFAQAGPHIFSPGVVSQVAGGFYRLLEFLGGEVVLVKPSLNL